MICSCSSPLRRQGQQKHGPEWWKDSLKTSKTIPFSAGRMAGFCLWRSKTWGKRPQVCVCHRLSGVFDTHTQTHTHESCTCDIYVFSTMTWLNPGTLKTPKFSKILKHSESIFPYFLVQVQLRCLPGRQGALCVPASNVGHQPLIERDDRDYEIRINLLLFLRIRWLEITNKG